MKPSVHNTLSAAGDEGDRHHAQRLQEQRDDDDQDGEGERDQGAQVVREPAADLDVETRPAELEGDVEVAAQRRDQTLDDIVDLEFPVGVAGARLVAQVDGRGMAVVGDEVAPHDRAVGGIVAQLGNPRGVARDDGGERTGIDVFALVANIGRRQQAADGEDLGLVLEVERELLELLEACLGPQVVGTQVDDQGLLGAEVFLHAHEIAPAGRAGVDQAIVAAIDGETGQCEERGDAHHDQHEARPGASARAACEQRTHQPHHDDARCREAGQRRVMPSGGGQEMPRQSLPAVGVIVLQRR